MLAKCYGGTINGVEASTVEIEVYSVCGTSSFAIVGLPDTAVKEAKDRVSTALKNSGYSSKEEYAVTVNLAPADVRKEGPIYDLPIAICLLKATKRLNTEELAEYAMVGELALSGEVRRVKGILPIVMEMRRIGKRAILVPESNAEEASVVTGIDVIPVRTLREAAMYLSGEIKIEPRFTDLADLVEAARESGDDFADVKGQETVRRAMELAVAGGHNMLMIGSPGAGKTMLARRIPSILPPMSVEEALEVSKIHSVAGAEKGGGSFVTQRPFRAPHHTVSAIGLLGGGSHPVPGEVSLAHRGVLFLDEFAEFPHNALEVLRQPLEDGRVTISRVSASLSYPFRVMLVAAMNPCPCGYAMDPKRACTCLPEARKRYQEKISGPLLDRIDIQVSVPPVEASQFGRKSTAESSAEIRKRICSAREIQRKRFEGTPFKTNAEMTSDFAKKSCKLSAETEQFAINAADRMGLSARGFYRLLKVGRTIADLRKSDSVEIVDLSEALRYRAFRS